MKINKFKVSYQSYIFPTIKITFDKILHGYYNIEFIWFVWGIEIKI